LNIEIVNNVTKIWKNVNEQENKDVWRKFCLKIIGEVCVVVIGGVMKACGIGSLKLKL
jgi:hypothetical protein